MASASLDLSADRPTIEFRCLGLFAFRVPNEAWQRAPSRAAGGHFLRYLANHVNASVACQSLADALWPDLDAGESAHRLHIAASGARTALRSIVPGVNPIVYLDSTYGWNPELRILRDIDVLEECFDRGTPDAYSHGVKIYAGAFLSGDNSDWVVPLRVRFEHMYATMLESLANNALEVCDYAHATNFALELVAVDRANERATQLTMISFARTGRRAQALAEYDDLERYLRRWLNVEPTLETQNLRASIVKGGPY
ncbi:MAG: bacterial transcriptional activator domain-containing protein [Candidatus Tumulicola sp.]